MQTFHERLAHLRNDIVGQGDRVLDITLKAVECYFDGDRAKAKAVIAADEEVDRVDVEIERASIPLLAMGMTDEKSIRSVLTIVKVNNELERIGDRASDLARMVISDPRTVALGQRIGINRITQATFVMIKSSLDSFINNDPELAHHILPTDDTVDRLYDSLHAELVREMETDSALIQPGARVILALHEIERMADHATNIAENVIFLIEAKLVRHRAVNDDASPRGSSEAPNNDV